ncbi:hypothetical protein IWQ56_007509, partial [Coemansia nantahalensis]
RARDRAARGPAAAQPRVCRRRPQHRARCVCGVCVPPVHAPAPQLAAAGGVHGADGAAGRRVPGGVGGAAGAAAAQRRALGRRVRRRGGRRAADRAAELAADCVVPRHDRRAAPVGPHGLCRGHAGAGARGRRHCQADLGGALVGRQHGVPGVCAAAPLAGHAADCAQHGRARPDVAGPVPVPDARDAPAAGRRRRARPDQRAPDQPGARAVRPAPGAAVRAVWVADRAVAQPGDAQRGVCGAGPAALVRAARDRRRRGRARRDGRPRLWRRVGDDSAQAGGHPAARRADAGGAPDRRGQHGRPRRRAAGRRQHRLCRH